MRASGRLKGGRRSTTDRMRPPILAICRIRRRVGGGRTSQMAVATARSRAKNIDGPEALHLQTVIPVAGGPCDGVLLANSA